ncbi:MAG: L,D-transpeptidase [Hyphomicrobiaceae bacterium]
MRFWTGAAAAFLAVAACTASTVVEAGTLKVSVDLTRQRMSVRENGETIYTWPVSSGRAGYRTITGTFKPQWMTRMHYSRKYDNSPMPNAIFFHGGFAIHGTYATGRLGSPASHGCVRLAPSNAKTLYNLVSKHGRAQTTISVYGTARDRAPVATASKTRRTYANEGSSRVTGYGSSAAGSARPKIIYRNGRAYIYVGKEAARRYYSKKNYSGSFNNY